MLKIQLIRILKEGFYEFSVISTRCLYLKDDNVKYSKEG